jgi:hypothetical protein
LPNGKGRTAKAAISDRMSNDFWRTTLGALRKPESKGRKDRNSIKPSGSPCHSCPIVNNPSVTARPLGCSRRFLPSDRAAKLAASQRRRKVGRRQATHERLSAEAQQRPATKGGNVLLATKTCLFGIKALRGLPALGSAHDARPFSSTWVNGRPSWTICFFGSNDHRQQVWPKAQACFFSSGQRGRRHFHPSAEFLIAGHDRSDRGA